MGDAYEYMISQFAAGAGKKAGEFYTPQEVSRILAEIVTLGITVCVMFTTLLAVVVHYCSVQQVSVRRHISMDRRKIRLLTTLPE